MFLSKIWPKKVVDPAGTHSHLTALNLPLNHLLKEIVTDENLDKVYTVLHALKVEVAPDKTYLGKASHGFDFLGKRILPIGILPSASALSRMQKNTVRLYEQGASQQRIVRYWVRWLVWAFLGLSPVVTMAGDCAYPYADTHNGPSNSLCSCFNDSFTIRKMSLVYYSVPPPSTFNPSFLYFALSCTSASDSVCSSNYPSTLVVDTTYYWKNTNSPLTPTADNYYSCKWTTLGFTDARLYTPTPGGGGGTPTPAPAGSDFWVIFSFGGLALAAFFALKRV